MTRWTVQLRLGLALVVGMLAVAACGGGTAPSAAPGGPTSGIATPAAPATAGQACTLLTDAEIAEITGTTVVSKDDSVADTIYANHCRWTLQRPDGGNGTFDLGILTSGGRELFDHSGGPSGLEPIEGLPADAAGEDGNLGGIYAVRGDTLVDVHTLSLALPTTTEVDLARRVLERVFGLPITTPLTGGQPSSAASDPCSLLSDQDILDATGLAPRGKQSSPRVGMWNAQCLWEVQGAGEVPAALTLTIMSPGGRESWDQYIPAIQGELTAIDGLGDAAFGKPHWPTHVLVGDTYFSVQFLDFPDPEGPVNTELARRVVANLGG